MYEDRLENPEFVKYCASKYNKKELYELRKEHVLRQIRERIFHKRALLASEFCKHSTNNLVTVEVWDKVMQKVISLPLQWNMLRPSLVETDAQNKINFHSFINRYQILISRFIPLQNNSHSLFFKK